MDSGRRGAARTPLALNGVICTLEELCTKKVLEGSLLSCGRKIEERARVIWRQSNPDSTSSDGRPKRRKRRSSTTILTETLDELDLRMSDSDLDFYTQTDYFLHQSSKCRDFLKTHLSSCTLDNLVSEVQQLSHRSGFFFALSSLCSDRLSHLPISDLRSGKHQQSIELMGSAISSHLLLECIGVMSNLARLTIHALATNIMLYSIAETCTKLQALDISFSTEVTDLGLLYLCGGAGRCGVTLERKPPEGCKYLRELHFNPQATSATINPVMPRVVAYILRQLKLLRICDFERLADGIQYYLHGPEGGYHPRKCTLANLKLTHFRGPSDNLTEEMLQICPCIRNLKLHVVDDNLGKVGSLLQSNPHIILDKVTLSYGEDKVKPLGLSTFLQGCGQRINILRLECSPKTHLTLEDLSMIANECPLLDGLEIDHLKLETVEGEASSMPSQQQQAFNFRFLTHMELSNVCSETFGREAALLLLGGCPDLESIIIDFKEKAWFFSDFFLDEVLCGNPMGRLESFRLRNVLMTLISALRLLNSRPKLTTIGHVLDWDVEPSEIETFGQIVKRAQSLHLLHEVTFL